MRVDVSLVLGPFLGGLHTCAGTLGCYISKPLIAKPRNDHGVRFLPEAAVNLRLIVAVEAEHRQIRNVVVCWIFVDMVNLQRAPGLMADTTRVIRRIERFGVRVFRTGMRFCVPSPVSSGESWVAVWPAL